MAEGVARVRGEGVVMAGPTIPKTCAICKHCSIDLGSVGWSDTTPAGSGEVTCARGHEEPGQEGAYIDLVRLAAIARACPDFELLEIADG